MEKYYVISTYDAFTHGYLNSHEEAIETAEKLFPGEEYTIEEWDNQEDYENNL